MLQLLQPPLMMSAWCDDWLELWRWAVLSWWCARLCCPETIDRRPTAASETTWAFDSDGDDGGGGDETTVLSSTAAAAG